MAFNYSRLDSLIGFKEEEEEEEKSPFDFSELDRLLDFDPEQYAKETYGELTPTQPPPEQIQTQNQMSLEPLPEVTNIQEQPEPEITSTGDEEKDQFIKQTKRSAGATRSFEPSATRSFGDEPDKLDTFIESMMQQYEQQRDEDLRSLPRRERLARNFGKGAVGTVKGIGGAMKAMGIKDTGDTVTNFADEIEYKYLSTLDDTFVDQVASGFGSAATFMIPGLGIAKGVNALAFAPKLAVVLGTTASSVLESMVEGGSTYEESMARGEDHKEAQQKAGKTFVLNLPLNYILDSWMFNKIPEGKAITSVLKGSGQEATQEYFQEIISSFAQGDPVLTAETQTRALTSGAIGGIVGGGIQTGRVVHDKVTRKPIAEVNQETIIPVQPEVLQPVGKTKTALEGEALEPVGETKKALVPKPKTKVDKRKKVTVLTFDEKGGQVEKEVELYDSDKLPELKEGEAYKGFVERNYVARGKLGEGIYSSTDKGVVKKYGANVSIVKEAYPKNPLTAENQLGVTREIAKIEEDSGVRYEAKEDIGHYIQRNSDYDGIVLGDGKEIVKFKPVAKKNMIEEEVKEPLTKKEAIKIDEQLQQAIAKQKAEDEIDKQIADDAKKMEEDAPRKMREGLRAKTLKAFKAGEIDAKKRDELLAKWAEPEVKEDKPKKGVKVGGELVADEKAEIERTKKQIDKETQELKKTPIQKATDKRKENLLDKQIRYEGKVMKKREWLQLLLDNGKIPKIVAVNDVRSKRQDEELVKRANKDYILGASNPNIPVVKAGLEAQARLKADNYKIDTYRAQVPGSNLSTDLTKTEYEHMKGLDIKDTPVEPQALKKEPVKEIDDAISAYKAGAKDPSLKDFLGVPIKDRIDFGMGRERPTSELSKILRDAGWGEQASYKLYIEERWGEVEPVVEDSSITEKPLVVYQTTNNSPSDKQISRMSKEEYVNDKSFRVSSKEKIRFKLRVAGEYKIIEDLPKRIITEKMGEVAQVEYFGDKFIPPRFWEAIPDKVLRSRQHEAAMKIYPKPEPPKTKLPSDVKPVKDTKLHGAIVKGKRTLQIIKMVNVKGGKMLSTDLTTEVITKTDLPDGIYELVKGKYIKRDDFKADDFPTYMNEGFKGKPVDYDVVINNEDIKQLTKYASDDETKLIVNGVHFKFANDNLFLQATNGFQLMQKFEGKYPGAGTNSFVIPTSTLKLLSNFKGDLPLKLKVSTDGVEINIGDTVVNSKIIQGKYPIVDHIIPTETKQKLKFDKNDMLNALKELDPYLPESNLIHIENIGDDLEVLAKHSDRGDKKVRVAGTIVEENDSVSPGDSVQIIMPIRPAKDKDKKQIEITDKEIMLNSKLFQQVIDNAVQTDIELLYKSNISPVVLIDEETGISAGALKEKKQAEPKTFASGGAENLKDYSRKKQSIITAEQTKRKNKKVSVKKRQLEIKDAKEAKEAVHGMIIRRRSFLDLSSLETNEFVHNIEQVTSPVQRELIPFLIEKTDVPDALGRKDLTEAMNAEKATPKLKEIVKQIRQHFDEGWEFMQANNDNMDVEQVKNYVTHIWDIPANKRKVVTNWFTTRNKFLKKRYIETLETGIKELGLKPKMLDIGDIIKTHDAVMHRVVANNKFVKELNTLRKNGVPLIEVQGRAPADWVLMDHPALRKNVVIPSEGKFGEKISPELQDILIEMGVAIGRRISPVAFGKPTGKQGEYRHDIPPEIRLQRWFETRTVAHEIGHHLDVTLDLGEEFLQQYKNELYAVNKERIVKLTPNKGKYGKDYAESTSEQIAEFFAMLFTNPGETIKIAPLASADILDRLRKDEVLTKLVDLDFEVDAKNLIEEQMNTMFKQAVQVHPDLVKPLNVIFKSRIDNKFINAMQTVNAILKKTQLSLSLFHHGALTETAIAIQNPFKAIKTIATSKGAVWKDIELSKDAVKHGLQLGASKDIPVQKIQDWLNTLALRSQKMPIVKQATKALATFNAAWDRALWDYLHDGLKLYGYEHLVSQLPLNTKNVTLAKREIAQFVNDTYGGQNWDLLMVDPQMVQMMSLVLLSPDWQYSTIRQALSPTGLGAISPETRALRRKLGRGFWTKVLLYYGVGINLLNYMFTAWDRKDDEDEDRPVWKRGRFMWENAYGHKTHLFAGKYDDGKERYIRWGKQFRELPELVIDPFKKTGGKASPAMQLTSQIFTGHSLSMFRNRDIAEAKGSVQKAMGIVKTILKSPFPFSTRSLFQKDKKFFATDLAFPSSKGMSPYKARDLFRKAILAGDENMVREVFDDALDNNLDAYGLFKTAMSSVKADNTRDINSGLKTVKEARDKFDKATSKRERDTLRRKIKRLKTQESNKRHADKLLEKAVKELGLLNRDKE